MKPDAATGVCSCCLCAVSAGVDPVASDDPRSLTDATEADEPIMTKAVGNVPAVAPTVALRAEIEAEVLPN
jgi:hypothetical protein